MGSEVAKDYWRGKATAEGRKADVGRGIDE